MLWRDIEHTRERTLHWSDTKEVWYISIQDYQYTRSVYVSVRYKNTKSVYPKRNTPLHPWRHMFIFNIYRTRHYLSVRPNLISHWGAEKDTLPIADVTKPSRLEMKHDIILKGMGRAWGGSLLNYSKITPWHLKWSLDDLFIYHWHFVLIVQKRDG